MQTAVVGYPRIGSLRELKFALEKYFRQEINANELAYTAKELRKKHWQTQKNAGIDYITSNDFSYYDIVLDTAFLLIYISYITKISLRYHHLTDILQWQEVIRKTAVMLRHLL